MQLINDNPTSDPNYRINRIISHPSQSILISAHDDRHIRYFDRNTGRKSRNACHWTRTDGNEWRALSFAGQMIHSMVAHLDTVTSLAMDFQHTCLLSSSTMSRCLRRFTLSILPSICRSRSIHPSVEFREQTMRTRVHRSSEEGWRIHPWYCISSNATVHGQRWRWFPREDLLVTESEHVECWNHSSFSFLASRVSSFVLSFLFFCHSASRSFCVPDMKTSSSAVVCKFVPRIRFFMKNTTFSLVDVNRHPTCSYVRMRVCVCVCLFLLFSCQNANYYFGRSVIVDILHLFNLVFYRENGNI